MLNSVLLNEIIQNPIQSKEINSLFDTAIVLINVLCVHLEINLFCIFSFCSDLHAKSREIISLTEVSVRSLQCLCSKVINSQLNRVNYT